LVYKKKQNKKLKHNAESAKDGWYLENIEVINLDAKKKWRFDCHRWLSIYRAPEFNKVAVLNAQERKLDINESACLGLCCHTKYCLKCFVSLNKQQTYSRQSHILCKRNSESSIQRQSRIRFQHFH
jgi:hypothetical protein